MKWRVPPSHQQFAHHSFHKSPGAWPLCTANRVTSARLVAAFPAVSSATFSWAFINLASQVVSASLSTPHKYVNTTSRMEGVKVGMVSHDPHKSPLLTSGVISSSTSCTKTKGANHWFITIPNQRQYGVPKATRGNSSSNHHLFWSCGVNSNGEMIHDALLALQGLVKIGKTAQTCNTGQASVTLRCAILSQSQVDDSVWCLLCEYMSMKFLENVHEFSAAKARIT